MKIAIHGLGIIGRELLKILKYTPGIEIVLLSDAVATKNLAYLLQYDSIYHDWSDKQISYDENGITIEGTRIELRTETDVSNLNLGKYNVDLLIDCSGDNNSAEKWQQFLNAGAKYVLSCGATDKSIPHIAYGVNQKTLTPNDRVISFAAMETQVSANVLKPLNKAYTVTCALTNAVRSYANSQPTIDSYNPKDFASGRAAAWNITPTNDASYKEIGFVVPELNGKVAGVSYRAPVIDGSIMNIVANIEATPSAEDLNAFFKSVSCDSLGYNEDALCSSDALGFKNMQYLAKGANVMLNGEGSSLVNLSVAYDNVRGYCKLIESFLKEVASNEIWF